MTQSRRKTTSSPKEESPSAVAPLAVADLIAALEQHKKQQQKQEEEAAASSSIEVYLNRNNFLLSTGVVLGTVGKLFPTEIPGVPSGTSLEGMKVRISMTESQFARLGGRVEEVRSSSGKVHRGVLDNGFKVVLQGDDFCVTPDLQEPGLLWLQTSCVKVLQSTPWAGATPVSATAAEIANAISLARESTRKALAARRQRQEQSQASAEQVDFGSVNLE